MSEREREREREREKERLPVVEPVVADSDERIKGKDERKDLCQESVDLLMFKHPC